MLHVAMLHHHSAPLRVHLLKWNTLKLLLTFYPRNVIQKISQFPYMKLQNASIIQNGKLEKKKSVIFYKLNIQKPLLETLYTYKEIITLSKYK